jgi:hypothetical protein
MKAVMFERNGEPKDVLVLGDLPAPAPGPGEILVRVRLAPVHPMDLHILRGRFGRQPMPPASGGGALDPRLPARRSAPGWSSSPNTSLNIRSSCLADRLRGCACRSK